MIDLSISMVVYKPDLAVVDKVFFCLNLAFIKMCKEFPSATFGVYIVDNSPGDGYIEKLKKILEKHLPSINHEIIKPKQNLGYGAGNNLAIKKAQSKYHLILNPDVFVQEDTILKAICYMDNHPKFDLLLPAVVGENGDRHYLCKQNPTLFISFLRSFAPDFLKKIFAKKMAWFEMRDKNYDEEIIDLPFPTGCFMLFRTPVLQKLKGFDESFFMYFEDADIGRRLLQISHSIYLPEVKIIHQWARGSHKNMRLRLIHIKSALTYFAKWGGAF